jgi:hypothetical protein
MKTSVYKVCQWLAMGRLISSGTPFSSTTKTDRHDVTEILLKVALNTINKQTKKTISNSWVVVVFTKYIPVTPYVW